MKEEKDQDLINEAQALISFRHNSLNKLAVIARVHPHTLTAIIKRPDDVSNSKLKWVIDNLKESV